ncbi:uncharacterized protein LOC18444403 isoform X2 [Amborella trichopoda]|uniref:uncharacterized protein LOC18444403 isoform X2 n=1 Tax=Amborella trichopoda TaxID=13333 RepID=UPI0009BD9BC1|nr:uncharacterized protein LOC18444403 isoform X2 [Amborella trichopoda]|eukprot:XP_020529400.1 uncharacterized protein LOC18444403 isoform X2 [Amborella trichopoda]
MSQQSHLPPRSPLLTRASPFTGSDSLFSPNQKSSEAFIRHQRSPSQSSAIEQPPSWLDELLIDSETSVKGFFHRRSSSDSAAFMGGPCDFPKLLSLAEEEDAIYSEVGLWPNGSRDQACFDRGENALSLSCELLSSLREKTKKNEALTKKNEALHDLDLACVYGPNSPRLKPNILNSEVSVAPSFSDECVAQRNELHGADNFRNLDSENSHGASCAHDTRLKGPRSVNEIAASVFVGWTRLTMELVPGNAGYSRRPEYVTGILGSVLGFVSFNTSPNLKELSMPLRL